MSDIKIGSLLHSTKSNVTVAVDDIFLKYCPVFEEWSVYVVAQNTQTGSEAELPLQTINSLFDQVYNHNT